MNDQIDPTMQAEPEHGTICLTVAEACEWLSIGKTTFYSLLNEGHFDTFKVRKRRLVTVASLHRFVSDKVRAETARRGYDLAEIGNEA